MMTKSNEYVFVAKDHTGKTIFLEKTTFEKHILVGHPEMAGNEAAIKDSIENPQYVVESKKDSRSQIYIAQSQLSSYPSTYIKTVVAHTEKYGFVRTAFFQRNMIVTKEGKVIFP